MSNDNDNDNDDDDDILSAYMQNKVGKVFGRSI